MPAPTEPILVTGATGFIAAHIVKQLLDGGCHVRGTVRSLKNSSGVDPLKALPGGSDRLELVEADLTRPGSFDAPARGCGYIIHTASPYVLTVADAQRDLVAPAVNGTREVLAAALRAGTVRRVVLTSSMGALTDEPDRAHVLTEADWNEKSSLDRNAYYYSKTLAERAAWAFMEEEPRPFDLVVINPFMVIGPSLTPSLNTSNQVFVDLMKGTYPWILGLAWGMVDVRDVAAAHILAMTSPSANGRYICAGDTMTMREVVGLLRSHGFDTDRLPTIRLDSSIGSALVRALAFTQSTGAASYLRTHVGRMPRYDTTKIRTHLGMTFRPIRQAILQTMSDLERWGHLPPSRVNRSKTPRRASS